MPDGPSTKLDAVRRIKPDDLRDAFTKGEVKIPSSQPDTHTEVSGDIAEFEQQAREVFGQDFFGAEAVINLQQKLRGAGLEIEFGFDKNLLLPKKEWLEELRNEPIRDRIVVLRPRTMKVKGEFVPISLENLRLKMSAVSPEVFGGRLIDPNDWDVRGNALYEPLDAGYAAVEKFTLPGSELIAGAGQDNLLLPGETRRSAVEAVWDTILFYSSTGQKLLVGRKDLTSTKPSLSQPEKFMCVGEFDDSGIKVYTRSADISGGLVPQVKLSKSFSF